MQNILIPNTSDLNVAKFIDTQVKYENAAVYRYNVYCERVVFGSKYIYYWVNGGENLNPNDKQTGFTKATEEQPDLPPEDLATFSVGLGESLNTSANGSIASRDLSAVLDVQVHPSIKMVEDLIFSTPDILIMDKPPVPPYVNIVPYRAVNNRVKILLDGLSDRYSAYPVFLVDGDQESFERVRAAQLSPVHPDGRYKIEFGSDDPVTSFQIFRIDFKPTSWTDFKFYKSTSGVFEEQILPNTKYYYTFRSVDTHDHVSNPSNVYEVELIDEKGAVRPLIRTISMEPVEKKSIMKECKKYIYLKPTPKQLHFAAGNESIFSDSGATAKKKRYKMRVTSKGSGKKLDINFAFHKKITESD